MRDDQHYNDDNKIIIHSSPELSRDNLIHKSGKRSELVNDSIDEDDEEDPDDDYADLEHDFDNDENEENSSSEFNNKVSSSMRDLEGRDKNLPRTKFVLKSFQQPEFFVDR